MKFQPSHDATTYRRDLGKIASGTGFEQIFNAYSKDTISRIL